jgi:hypothetical protein
VAEDEPQDRAEAERLDAQATKPMAHETEGDPSRSRSRKRGNSDKTKQRQDRRMEVERKSESGGLQNKQGCGWVWE